MNASRETLLRETFNASNEGKMHFAEVITRLVAAGIESYSVDYRSHHATYFLDNDETIAFELDTPATSIPRQFIGEDLQAAIRGSQQGVVMYPEFKRLSMAAGCVGYTVWISGRHVTYFGRNGETHVERFPDTSV